MVLVMHFRPLCFASHVEVATLAEEHVFLNAKDLLEEAHFIVLLCNILTDHAFELVSPAELDALTAAVLPFVHRKLETCLALHPTAGLHEESLVGDVDVRAQGVLLANLDPRLRLFLKIYDLNFALHVQNEELLVSHEDFHHGVGLFVSVSLVRVIDFDLFQSL